jgi:hypothetical protein
LSAGLKTEDGAPARHPQQIGQVAIEVAEEGIIARGLRLTVAKCEPERGRVKPPCGDVIPECGAESDHIAISFRRGQQRPDKLVGLVHVERSPPNALRPQTPSQLASRAAA